MIFLKRGIILLAALGVLAGAYFLLKDRIGANQGDSGIKSNYQKLYDIDRKTVTRVVLNKQGEIFEVARNPEYGKDDDGNKDNTGRRIPEWILVQPADIKADSNKLDNMVRDAASVGSSKLIEEDAQDISVYGFDNPSILTVYTDDGKETVLEIGAKAYNGGYYIKLPETNKIWLLDSIYAEQIMVTRNSLKDKQLFYTNLDDINYFALDRGGANVFTARINSSGDWMVVEPLEVSPNIYFLDYMYGAVSNLRISEFIEENPESLSEYGLDNPSYAMEFGTVDGTRERILLGLEKGSEIYAMLEGRDEVFTVFQNALQFLDTPQEKMIDSFVYLVEINAVKSVLVEMDGYTVDLKLETDPEDRDKDKFYVNGRLAIMEDEQGRQPFRKYFISLIGITHDKIELEAQPEEKAEITITYEIKKPPYKMKVEFIPKNNSHYYAVKNGKYSGLLVRKSEFDKWEGVRESYRTLMDALEKAEQEASQE